MKTVLKQYVVGEFTPKLMFHSNISKTEHLILFYSSLTLVEVNRIVFSTKPLSRCAVFSLLRHVLRLSYVNQINGFVSECALSGKKDLKK